MGFIYKIEHRESGKIYIGKTARTLEERMKEHRWSNELYIDRAIRKYGINAFEVSVVEECADSNELNEREIFWIAFYNCKNPNGYNMTDGGDGGAGHVVSEEAKKKISEFHKGRKKSEKTCKKISESKTGNCLSKEHRNKIGETIRGHIVSPETRAKKSISCRNKRAVVCIETGEIFESIAAAAKWVGISRDSIADAIYGRIKSAGGYHWRLDNKVNENATEDIFHKRPVCCVETGEIFESVKAASKWAGVASCTITGVLRGRYSTTAGYHWKYAN